VPDRLQTATNAHWKQRFYANSMWWRAELAPQEPSRGMVLSATSGTVQISAWDRLSGKQRQLTHHQEGVFQGYLSPKGRHVYYLRDTAGNERGHYVRVPWEGGDEQDLTPEMLPYTAIYPCAVNATETLFAFTPTEPDSFPLYCLDLYPNGEAGMPRELYRSPKLTHDVVLSYNAEIAVVATTERSQARQYSLLAINTGDGRQIGVLSDLPRGSIYPLMFAPLPGDTRLLAMADHSGYNRPLIWHLHDGRHVDVPLFELAGDIEPLDWSPNGRRILLRHTYRAMQRLFTYDLETDTLTRLEHRSGTYIHAQFGPLGQIVALWSDSTHLPQIVALDEMSGEWQGTLLSQGETPPARPLTSVSFPSSDGVEIQGWLGLPEGRGPFPTILFVHGGPHLLHIDVYDHISQAWLDHGYAFLAINYRGSTNFGRAFKEQIWGDLGHWEVEDMVAARQWLIDENIAQPNAILVTGGSYGGYLTLMALGKRPELWAGGMVRVAPADQISAFEDGNDWVRGFLTAMMGGTPTEKREAYIASSPMTYAAQVTAPLLVIQGRNDMRCPARPMEAYAEKMRSLGKPFEIDWFDAGHGRVSTEMLIAFQERQLDFAYRIVSNIKSS